MTTDKQSDPTAEFALGITFNEKSKKYELFELHVAEGMVVERKQLRVVAGAKEAFGHMLNELEIMVPDWRRRGLLK